MVSTVLSLADVLGRKAKVRLVDEEEPSELTLFQFLDLECGRVPCLIECAGQLRVRGVTKVWPIVATPHRMEKLPVLHSEMHALLGGIGVHELRGVLKGFGCELGAPLLDEGLCAALGVTSETDRTRVLIDLIRQAQASRGVHELQAQVDNAFIAGLLGNEAEQMSIAPEVVRLANARGLELWRSVG